MKQALEALFPVLFAVSLHELGHILCLRIFRIPRKRASFCFWGIGLDADFSHSSHICELAVYAAGSLCNLLFALLLSEYPEYKYACIAYGVFNLLPAGFLDGGEILRIMLLSTGFSHYSVKKLCGYITLAFCVLLWMISVYLALRGYGAALLVSSLYMLGFCFSDKKC
ncbi:MAG: hypothetical protein IJD67_04640 [Clostridia bacterium]|nr:hypothetical protein [Clostridia bacterium]